MSEKNVIEVRQLHKKYGDITAVEDISFSVPEGSVFVLVGPNGAGKTTTIEMIEGLREPTSGEVRVLGMDPVKNRKKLYRQIGVQLQEQSLHPRQKVKEILNLFSSFYPNALSNKEILEIVGLENKENQFYGKLSGGQRRRVLLATAVIGNPRLLILDEPTSGLDPQARYNIWELLKRMKGKGTTIFLTTHYMEEAEEHGDMLCIIDRGRVITSGNPADMLKKHGMETMIKVPSSIDQTLIEQIPNVRKVERVDRYMFLYGEGAKFLEEASATLQTGGFSMQDMETRRAKLEDLYLLMTGHHYRKE